MYKLLIVDDELYAVEAVRAGVDWESLGFTDILCAYDAEEAQDALKSNAIDVLISDIEMPGMNGIELLEWVNEHSPSTVTVFLTGHADFSYAREAMRYGGFDYLLKPIRYEQLKQVVARALKEVEQSRELHQLSDQYRRYAKQRETQQPLLVERFWQDVFSGQIRPSEDNAADLLNSYEVTLNPDMPVLPILLSVEYWQQEFNQRDEDILEYALRNAASELFIGDEWTGDIVADRSGSLFAMLYLPEWNDDYKTKLVEKCKRYTEACSQYFYCSISSYIGEVVSMVELPNVYYRLLEMERANVSEYGKVYLLSEYHAPLNTPQRLPTLSVDMEEWALLLESGRKDELLQRIDQLFQQDDSSSITSETLDAIYHTLLGFVYQTAHLNGWSIKQVIGESKWLDATAITRSAAQCQAWARKLIKTMAEYIQNNRNVSSALIEKVKAYVNDHLASVSREEIASHVFINPAYLSRLFKRETGQSLVDYIIGAKISKAKLSLTETNVKISDICNTLGYESLSYFAKTFKKQTGITPQEYRKRYQNIGI